MVRNDARRRKKGVLIMLMYKDEWDAMTDYDRKALCYAEDHGVLEYWVDGSKMFYYTSFPIERKTYKAEVDLDTGEEKRVSLKKYYKAYTVQIDGKAQANYCV